MTTTGPSPASMKPSEVLTRCTALYVEADARMRATVCDALRGEFDELLLASDGREALECFEAETVHLVITDAATPKLTGFELARAIRSHDRDLPILMTSDAPRTAELLQAVPLNLVDYLIKPVSYARLKQALAECARRVQETARLLTEIDEDLAYDAAHHTLVGTGEPVPLSRKESALLELLLRQRGKLVTKKRIASTVYADEDAMTEAALKNLLLKLRRKLGRERLVNVYNRGFMLKGDPNP